MEKTYVLIPTNLRIGLVGGVYGPYPTRAEAKKALYEDFDFPTPEEVLIRPMYSGPKTGDEQILMQQVLDESQSE